MIKRIYLIRHGMIDTGNEKRYLGITDLPLNQAGIKQAVFLKNYFKNTPIDYVFTSPLKRCLQTADILCGGIHHDFTAVKEFMEINLGLWENIPMETIKRDFPDAYEERGKNLLTFKPPEGESFGQLAERVLPAFDCIAKHYSGNIMIIGHAGVNRTILSKIQGNSIQDFFQIQQPFGCVYELIWNDDSKWHVKRLV